MNNQLYKHFHIKLFIHKNQSMKKKVLFILFLVLKIYKVTDNASGMRKNKYKLRYHLTFLPYLLVVITNNEKTP